MTSKRMINQVDRYKMLKLLEEHLNPKDEEGLVTYKGDMTDAKIAALIGPNTSPSSVSNTRNQVFGRLRKARQQTFEARLTRLEETVATLVQRL